ncbi:hypothetical protein O59_001213 [Cellvibrio sp. BR]|nr:hypothetical protein O59_001213 [Cellvibrio sp. BR]
MGDKEVGANLSCNNEGSCAATEMGSSQTTDGGAKGNIMRGM